MPPEANFKAWLNHLERRDPSLTDAERQALAQVISEVVEVGPDQDIVRQHDRLDRSSLMLEGWCCRYLTLSDGRRQILALHVPGEFVDLHSFPVKRMDHNVATLTRCRLGYAPHENLRRLTETHPHLTRLLWLSTLIDGAILRQWLLGVGQRSALENTAHMLCELYLRLQVAGLAGAHAFAFPLTQVELADALGISAVHTNRVLQELRARRLVAWQAGKAQILNWEGLAALAEFDPAYLELTGEPR